MEKELDNETENTKNIHAKWLQETENWLLEALVASVKSPSPPNSVFTVGRRKTTLLHKEKIEQSGTI